MDAISLLKADHRTVEELFARFEKLGEGKEAQKRKIVDQLIKELSVHAGIEETVLYPAARELIEETEDQVKESLEEHYIVKWMLSELQKMKPDHDRFDAKVTVLKELIEHHVEEEEGELFPKLRQKLSKKQLVELGEAMMTAKKVAPTRPHPMAPDEPPGNFISSAGAAVIDRIRDAGRRFVTGRSGDAPKKKNGATKKSATKKTGGRKRVQSGTHRVRRAA